MSLRKIAAALDLSITTVSRALADYDDVAPTTRGRVRAEAERIGYVPNATARRLQKGRTDSIGVAVPSSSDAFGDSYLAAGFNGAWERLAELDQDLLLLPFGEAKGGLDERSVESKAFRRAAQERRVDGMLLVRPLIDDPRIDTMERTELPYVLLEADPSHHPDASAVGIDEAEAARLVCRRLAELGHTGFVAIGPREGFDFAKSRLEHLERQAAALGLGFSTIAATSTEGGAREAVEGLVAAAAPPPTALVFLNNRMTIGGLSGLAGGPLVVGRHVSVIGYGDSPALRQWSPATTVVCSPIQDMARHAVDVLVAKRDRRLAAIRPLWRPTLETRRSDGPPMR